MKYIIPILLIIMSIACKKGFLDPIDPSSLNRQTYVNSLSTMEEFTNGIQLMIERDFQRGVAVAYGDLIADNLKPATAASPAMMLQYSWSQKASESTEDWVSGASTAMNGEWKNGYLSIRACNFVIENIDKYRSENPAKSDNLKGRAYAIRAMIHFKLANLFAQTYSFTNNASHISVPYITTSDIMAQVTRLSTTDVYDYLINDLKEAIKLMPPGIPYSARMMNQPAAKALLAKVYLYKEDFENAKKVALEVTDSYPLMTITAGYPEKIYYNLGTGATESLYQFFPSDNYTLVTNFVGSAFRGYTVTFRPTHDIEKLYRENPNDIRNKWIQETGTGIIVSKYPMEIAKIHLSPAADYYHTVIRSSEMFLTVAEASFRTGDEPTARRYLDAIRKRADPSLTDIIATGEALKDSIYKERRKELAFEGTRMFDLQRWHSEINRVDILSPGMSTTLAYPSNKAIAPIPIPDIRISGISQNKDY